jgi:hypothetical protein
MRLFRRLLRATWMRKWRRQLVSDPRGQIDRMRDTVTGYSRHCGLFCDKDGPLGHDRSSEAVMCRNAVNQRPT